MCPMSAVAQAMLIVCAIALLCAKAALALNTSEWTLNCQPQNVTVLMYESVNVTCDIQGPARAYSEHTLVVKSSNPSIANAAEEIWLEKAPSGTQYYPESFIIYGEFIGETNVSVQVRRRNENVAQVDQVIDTTVTRKKGTLDLIFHVSVIALVTLMYVNFGCAFNWGALRENMRRPIAPVSGFLIQVIFMPLISFGLGRLLFPGNTPMQLGLFFTGIAPSGGASNMWTLLLGGNLDLSITMTTMSNVFAFGTMPFWAFTLGRVIYHEGNMQVPYAMILNYSLCLVVPLLVGYVLQRFCPRISQFMVRILKGLSALLLIFIIVFAIVTNTYIFKLFSWEIVLAGLGLPWGGAAVAFCLALLLKRSRLDAMTIAIETGIQNTGVPIGLLKTTLQQPAADLTTVMPVAVAVMTPFPLIAMYCYKLIRQRIERKECEQKDHRKLMDGSPLNSPMSELLDNDNNFNVTGPNTKQQQQQAKLKLDDNYFNSMDLKCNI